ncbi:MAG: InlB B-repeat-containing protein, partial [Eggerthellales bacterium]|nr:InlB B-repeat-containing protein [Eggerthellales bacterium]
EGGLISRNTAAETGGGIAGCCACSENVLVTGGEISLNCAAAGGGVGEMIRGTMKPGTIHDNLASEAGDDVLFMAYSDSFLNVVNPQSDRPYSHSYASDSPLSSQMQTLSGTALPTMVVDLLDGYPEPLGVMIPFVGWYYDGNNSWNSDQPRYQGLEGDKFALDLEQVTLDSDETRGQGIKALWSGVVLLYVANYEGCDDFRYDPQGYTPGQEAEVLEGMFTRDGYMFTGWNTSPDGTGEAYAPGDAFLMEESSILYAQWEPVFKVTYQVLGDPTYGIPAMAEDPAYTDGPYLSGDQVTIQPDPWTEWTTSDGTPSGLPGIWVFSGWDTEDFVITQDTDVAGSWTFTPSEKDNPDSADEPGKTDGPAGPNGSDDPANGASESYQQGSLPETGDGIQVAHLVILAALCGACLALLAPRGRKTRF